jgi:methyl-accepting chemotaxis protein
VIQEVGEHVKSIAAGVEEQASVTRDVTSNTAEAAAGVQDANARASQTAVVSRSMAKDIAAVNAAVDISSRAAKRSKKVRPG